MRMEVRRGRWQIIQLHIPKLKTRKNIKESPRGYWFRQSIPCHLNQNIWCGIWLAKRAGGRWGKKDQQKEENIIIRWLHTFAIVHHWLIVAYLLLCSLKIHLTEPPCSNWTKSSAHSIANGELSGFDVPDWAGECNWRLQWAFGLLCGGGRFDLISRCVGKG